MFCATLVLGQYCPLFCRPGSVGQVEPDFPIDRVRADTPGASGVLHFNNAGSALPPDVVVDTVTSYLRREAEIGGYEAAAEAHESLEAAYTSVATLVGGRPDQVAITENATRAWDMAVYGYPFQPGDRIVTGRSEYASNLLAFLQLEKRFGIEIVLVEDDADGQIDLIALERELEAGAEMVSLTHVATSGGMVNPAAAVGELCRQYGVFYVLDACQSLGQVPVDVAELGCDVLSSTGRKYLRGPRGTGLLWVSDNAFERIEPPFVDLHAAVLTTDETYELRGDARRFEGWERYVAGQLGLGSAIDYLLALGVDETTTRLRALAVQLRESLGEIGGVHVHDKGKELGGIVTFTVDGQTATETKVALREAGINTSVATGDTARFDLGARGLDEVVRASVHYYNTTDEIDRFEAAVRELSRA